MPLEAYIPVYTHAHTMHTIKIISSSNVQIYSNANPWLFYYSVTLKGITTWLIQGTCIVLLTSWEAILVILNKLFGRENYRGGAQISVCQRLPKGDQLGVFAQGTLTMLVV